MEQYKFPTSAGFVHVALFFEAPEMIGVYGFPISFKKLACFQQDAEESGGQLVEEDADRIRYNFIGPGSAVTVERLASPFRSKS